MPPTGNLVAATCTMPGGKPDLTRGGLVGLPVMGLPTSLHVQIPHLTCPNPTCNRKIV